MKMCADVHISPPNSNWLILQVLDTESLFLCTVFHSELMPYLPTFESSHSGFLPNRELHLHQVFLFLPSNATS